MEPHTKRALGLIDLTGIGLNAIVGSSIFLFPGLLAGYLGPASIVSFGLVGLLLLSVGLCFAEASTYFDKTGGSYWYAREAFGEWPGFGIGWMTWVAQVFAWAAVADAIAAYLGYFDPRFSTDLWTKGIAATVILSMGCLNYRGAKLGARVSDFFVAAKLIPLLIFIAWALPKAHAANFMPLAPLGWAPMGKACFLAYFAFQGFESIPVPSGEVENPGRNVPIAVIASILFASLLYMLIQTAFVGVAPELAGSAKPLAEAAFKVMGPMGAVLMVAGASISMTGYNSSTALVTPRYLEALSEDKQLPPFFGHIHPRFKTPYVAIAVTTAVTLVMAVGLDFRKLVDFSNVVVCAQYVATCASIPFLRKRLKAAPGSFRLPAGILIPLIGCAATLWLGFQGGVTQIWWSLGILVAGFVFRYAYHLKTS